MIRGAFTGNGLYAASSTSAVGMFAIRLSWSGISSGQGGLVRYLRHRGNRLRQRGSGGPLDRDVRAVGAGNLQLRDGGSVVQKLDQRLNLVNVAHTSSILPEGRADAERLGGCLAQRAHLSLRDILPTDREETQCSRGLER